MADMAHYIYHSEKGKRYFGRYNNVSRDIYYAIEENVAVPQAAKTAAKDGKHAVAASSGTATTGAIRPIVPPSKAAAQAATVTDVVALTAVKPSSSSSSSSSSAAAKGNSSSQWEFRLPPYSSFNISVSGVLNKVIGSDTIAKMKQLLSSATGQ
jgi:hypothetical protein